MLLQSKINLFGKAAKAHVVHGAVTEQLDSLYYYRSYVKIKYILARSYSCSCWTI